MPFRSKAQQRFMFAKHPKMAKEFADATPDIKSLPEHIKKMAEGGEVSAAPPKGDKFQEDFKESFKNGIQGDWESLKAAVKGAADKYNKSDNGTLKGLRDTMKKTQDTQNMADGGMVDEDQFDNNMGNTMQNSFSKILGSMNPMGPIQAAAPAVTSAVQNFNPLNMAAEGLATGTMNNQLQQQSPQTDPAFIAQLNQGINTTNTPTINPIGQAAQQIHNLPPTAPNVYQGISADDRANLYKQLLAQKSSPGMLAASGVAGLGDAITSAFGKSPTNTQGNLRQATNQNVEQRIGGVDIERQQKLQDVQANIAVQKADPNSSFSQGMRNFLKSQGIGVPSGMSAAMLEPMFGEMAKMFEARTVAATAAGAQGVDAGKALMGETLWDKFKEEIGLSGPAAGEAYLEKKVGASAPAPGASMTGWSIKR